jgi:hypothetical protein
VIGAFADFLSWHNDESMSASVPRHHAERALSLLIQQNAAKFGEMFDAYPDMTSLHKAFRQTDVFDSAELDMAFWHLFHASRLIWEWETEGHEDFQVTKRLHECRSKREATP